MNIRTVNSSIHEGAISSVCPLTTAYQHLLQTTGAFMFPNSLGIPLATQRLNLRLPAKGDVGPIYFLRSDPVVNQHIRRQRPEHPSDIETFIDERLDDYQNSKSIYLVIEIAKQATGTICLWNFSEDFKQAELGYDLHPKFHGQGIMSEAVQAMLNLGFTELQLDVIEAYTHFENVKSTNMLTRNGFTRTEKRDPDVDTNVVFAIQSS